MKHVINLLILLSISVNAYSGNGMTSIEEILGKDSYATAEWTKRGLNRSPAHTVLLMEQVTKSFLKRLKQIRDDEGISKSRKRTLVTALIGDLPWSELDREEKDFLADVLAPAIESLGFNPWELF